MMYYVIGALLVILTIVIIIKINYFEGNLLLKGVKKGDLNMVKKAINNGIDINYKNKSLQTPLMLACEKCNYELVKFLIDNGAYINAIDNVGQNALFYSLNCENIEEWKKIVDLLIKKGIDINKKSEGGYTVLSTAPQYDIEFFKYLLEKGADVNIQNDEGNTMIMDEISYHNTDIVKILLKYNPDITIKNKEGKTAFDIAKEKNYEDIIKLLNDYKRFKNLN